MRDARGALRAPIGEVPVVGPDQRLLVGQARRPAKQPLRLGHVHEGVPVRRLVVPFRERRETRELEPAPGGAPEPAWSISAGRSERTVPNFFAPTLNVSPAASGAAEARTIASTR